MRPGELLAQEREREPAEVRPAAGAADDDVGRLADLRELQQRLLADDRLVEEHVVEDAAQRVAGLRVARGDLDRLADRDAQRAGVLRGLGEDRAAGLGQLRRRAVDRRPERLHHHPPVGLLVVRGADLPHLDVDAEQRAGEGERGAPLAGAGLGRQLPDAVLGVVVGLRDGGVRLVRAGRRDALVLVVDLGRRAERLLEPVRAVQRRRPPQPVDVEHLVGDVDVPVLGDLLQDQVHREQRREVLGARPARSVPGCSGGGGGLGRSGTRLYHCVGIRDSSSRIFVGTSGTPFSFGRGRRRAGRRAAG